MAVELNVGVEFSTFIDTEKAVYEFCEKNYHAIRVDNKLTVGNANKKTNEKITTLANDDMCSCR